MLAKHLNKYLPSFFSFFATVSIPCIRLMCSRAFSLSLVVTPPLTRSANVYNIKCLIVHCWLSIRAFVTIQIYILMLEFYTNKTAQMWVIWHWIFLFRLRKNLDFEYNNSNNNNNYYRNDDDDNISSIEQNECANVDLLTIEYRTVLLCNVLW